MKKRMAIILISMVSLVSLGGLSFGNAVAPGSHLRNQFLTLKYTNMFPMSITDSMDPNLEARYFEGSTFKVDLSRIIVKYGYNPYTGVFFTETDGLGLVKQTPDFLKTSFIPIVLTNEGVAGSLDLINTNKDQVTMNLETDNSAVTFSIKGILLKSKLDNGSNTFPQNDDNIVNLYVGLKDNMNGMTSVLEYQNI